MKLRHRIAESLRYVAYDLRTPPRAEHVLLMLAERVWRHTALTCKHCGFIVDYRGDVDEQAGRAVDHFDTHYPKEGN